MAWRVLPLGEDLGGIGAVTGIVHRDVLSGFVNTFAGLLFPVGDPGTKSRVGNFTYSSLLFGMIKALVVKLLAPNLLFLAVLFSVLVDDLENPETKLH